jgi:hypothetical protein
LFALFKNASTSLGIPLSFKISIISFLIVPDIFSVFEEDSELEVVVCCVEGQRGE